MIFFCLFVFWGIQGEFLDFWVNIRREIIDQSWLLLTPFSNFAIVDTVLGRSAKKGPFSRPCLLRPLGPPPPLQALMIFNFEVPLPLFYVFENTSHQYSTDVLLNLLIVVFESGRAISSTPSAQPSSCEKQTHTRERQPNYGLINLRSEKNPKKMF